MTEASALGPERAKLPRRDWILLPALSLLTVCLLAGSIELGAWRTMPRNGRAGEDCLVLHDPSTGVAGIPNCVVTEKIPEGRLTVYRFNSSGYRDDVNFGPKPPGVYRIVILGTSMAAGFRVPEAQTFSALLPEELLQRTGRKIQIYNEALPWRSPSAIARHFNEALAVNPDLILWVLDPLDIGNTTWVAPRDNLKDMGLKGRAWYHIKAAFAGESLMPAIGEIFSHTRASFLLRDFLYASPSVYVRSSLAGNDYKKEFLESDSSPEWVSQLREFENSAANIEGQAMKAGVPLAAVLVPDRTQAAMISMMGKWPKGYDPYKLDHELRTIIVRHDGIYIDILPDFQAVPNPQLGYFAIDGHLNSRGQAMIAEFLADHLTGGTVPALDAARRPHPGLEAHR